MHALTSKTGLYLLVGLIASALWAPSRGRVQFVEEATYPGTMCVTNGSDREPIIRWRTGFTGPAHYGDENATLYCPIPRMNSLSTQGFDGYIRVTAKRRVLQCTVRSLTTQGYPVDSVTVESPSGATGTRSLYFNLPLTARSGTAQADCYMEAGERVYGLRIRER